MARGPRAEALGWGRPAGRRKARLRGLEIVVLGPVAPQGCSVMTGELLAELRRLDRAEKLRVVQFLVNELVVEEATLPLSDGSLLKYEMWSNGAAANVLYEMLQQAEAKEPPPTRD